MCIRQKWNKMVTQTVYPLDSLEFKVFATDYSIASFEQCRVMLALVWRFYITNAVWCYLKAAQRNVKRLYELL